MILMAVHAKIFEPYKLKQVAQLERKVQSRYWHNCRYLLFNNLFKIQDITLTNQEV